MKLRDESIATLRQAGIIQPLRLVNLIQKAIDSFELDLSGLTVLTEAASGPYVVTPVIAVLAGAKRVLGLTRDSKYASAETVKTQTQALETLCNLENRVEIFTQRSIDLFTQADIITNLGFVRPIDATVVAAMKPGSAVPLMCEAWEFRPGDVDFEACQRRGVVVMATNEDFPGLEVFANSGLLCLKMLFEASIEVYKSRIIVVSGDKFGKVIERQLIQSGASVQCVETLRTLHADTLSTVDAVIVADYIRRDTIIGPDGDLTADSFAHLAPRATVIQFAGHVDVKGLLDRDIYIYPGIELGPHRMAQTLAALGPRPVVDLHTAGLKVGELLARNDIRQDTGWLARSKYGELCVSLNTKLSNKGEH